MILSFPPHRFVLSRLKKWVAVSVFLFGAACGAELVQIDFFYEPGCHDCERIEAEVLPEIERQFPDTCVIQRHDIGIDANFIHLMELEEAIGTAGSERAYLIVNRQVVFGASPDLQNLFSVISNQVAQGAEPLPLESVSGAPVKERFVGFTLPAVILAGLLDGINPCAISTLVFFMSLLAVSKIRNRDLLLLGISFCAASFLTYLALGFGLFRMLHLFSGFTALRSAVEWGMIAVLLILSVLSFRDALRFRKSHDGKDVTLQLSMGMKKRIHNVMRRGLGVGSMILGGLLIGTAVTAFESVCTGQVYVPTLVLILKQSAFSEHRAWHYLLVYNLMFILPLVLTFVAVYFGLKTDTLLHWSRQNVVLSKTLLAVFFLLMILLIARF